MSNHPSTSTTANISGSSSSIASLKPSASISESELTNQLLDFRRRFSSDSTFFTDAATSFQPKPYNPNNPANFSRTGSSSSSITSTRSRSSQDLSLTIHPAGMDPSPSDPGAFFIHPPFDVFPGAEDHPGGLTYLLIASQPEWFLDANDFIYPGSTNPNAIPYPTKLEPPRGWCPARKRDLEKSGKDGWPTGEEPRLRCTFCRRTYAGVNAKSMWRRHVFEKHKIAMSNRRDGADKSGRGGRSAKSSSQSTSPQPTAVPEDDGVSSQDGQESVGSIPEVIKEEKEKPAPQPKRKARNQPSRKKSSEVAQKDLPHPLAQSTLPSNTPPPPTPPPMEPTLSRDSFDAPPEGISAQELEAAQQLIAVASTPVPARFLAPQDPASSPSYRFNESPLRRSTSDQSWRYSPSDPRAKLMLTAVSASPAFPGVGTPESRERFKPSPRSLFGGSKSRLPVSLADRLNDSPFNDSPLSRPIRQPGFLATPLGASSSSSAKNDWLFDGLSPWPKLNTDDMLRSPPMSGFNSSPLKGTGMTPFKDLLGLTGPVGPTVVDMSEDSPVVRRRTQQPQQTPIRKSASAGEEGALGLGIGLMEPFSLAGATSSKKNKKKGSSIGGDSDVDVDAEFPPIKSDDDDDERNRMDYDDLDREEREDEEEEDEGSTLVASTSSKASSSTKSDVDRPLTGTKHAREDDDVYENEGERPAKKTRIKLAIDDD